MPNVILNIAGQKWAGWLEVRIQSSIKQISSEFTLKLTDTWAATAQPRTIIEGQSCSIEINDQVVITGFIDEVTLSYDDKSHTISVSGRDVTADLVDCSAPSFSWAGQSLLQGAKKLLQPYHINVISHVNVSKPFSRLKADEGETVFELLANAARIRGVLLLSDGLGGMVISRAGMGVLQGALELGVNIKSGSNTRSLRDRFSDYTVKGQSSSPFGEDTSYSASVKDNQITRHRPKTILAEDVVDIAACKERALWQRNRASAESHTVNYTVNDWYLSGELLRPNQRVKVVDGYLNINRQMLIEAVSLIIDGQGLRAELSLAEIAAYELKALPEPAE